MLILYSLCIKYLHTLQTTNSHKVSTQYKILSLVCSCLKDMLWVQFIPWKSYNMEREAGYHSKSVTFYSGLKPMKTRPKIAGVCDALPISILISPWNRLFNSFLSYLCYIKINCYRLIAFLTVLMVFVTFSFHIPYSGGKNCWALNLGYISVSGRFAKF